jgi:hypothetical protein
MVITQTAADTAPADTLTQTVLGAASVGTFTAVAATDLMTCSVSHGFVADDLVRFTSTTTLPAGLSAGVSYYVISSGLTATAFKVSTTSGGTAVDITSTGTGTHTVYYYRTVDAALSRGLKAIVFLNQASVSRPTDGQIWPRGDDYRRRAS